MAGRQREPEPAAVLEQGVLDLAAHVFQFVRNARLHEFLGPKELAAERGELRAMALAQFDHRAAEDLVPLAYEPPRMPVGHAQPARSLGQRAAVRHGMQHPEQGGVERL